MLQQDTKLRRARNCWIFFEPAAFAVHLPPPPR
jgi:hypothetical protein